MIHPHARLDVPPLLRNARLSATAAGIWTDCQCGVTCESSGKELEGRCVLCCCGCGASREERG